MESEDEVGFDDDPFVMMKKSKKFIKFKDYIVAMPNS
jgi:hypothetical protein